MLPAWLEDETATVPEYAAFVGAGSSGGPSPRDRRQLRRRRDVPPGRHLPRGVADRLPDRGRGRRGDALVFGLPHPNEPIGGLTAVHLARRLADDADLRERLGHRWHVVACIDPDGLRLNEGWLAGPFTREHYLRHFYRPAGDEQVEWTFPRGPQAGLLRRRRCPRPWP